MARVDHATADRIERIERTAMRIFNSVRLLKRLSASELSDVAADLLRVEERIMRLSGADPTKDQEADQIGWVCDRSDEIEAGR